MTIDRHQWWAGAGNRSVAVEPPETMPHHPVRVQTMVVTSLANAVAFYTQVLGYTVKAAYGPAIVQLDTGDRTTLILQETHPAESGKSPATVLAFQTDDIAASMQAVAAAGGTLLDLSPRPCPVGVVAEFLDPAGIRHQLIQFSNPD